MRGIINKEPVRKDYLRGLDKSIQELKANGYKVPGTADIITYNTPLVAIGIAQDKGDQARYIHTAVSTITGGLLDMPTLPLLVSQIRYCPVCMCTVPYVRTWHNLPGVDSCAIHEVDLCSLEDTSSISWRLERSKCEASSPEKIAYAKYVKSVYDHPTDIWIARRHCTGKHTKSYYDALQVLVKKGYVYRVDFGMYSNRDDLSVYEILRWKYLLDDEGKPVGRFTGDTARYLEHQIEQEPEIIALESSLLSRKSWSAVNVKGRKVKIRGI